MNGVTRWAARTIVGSLLVFGVSLVSLVLAWALLGDGRGAGQWVMTVSACGMAAATFVFAAAGIIARPQTLRQLDSRTARIVSVIQADPTLATDPDIAEQLTRLQSRVHDAHAVASQPYLVRAELSHAGRELGTLQRMVGDRHAEARGSPRAGSADGARRS